MGLTGLSVETETTARATLQNRNSRRGIRAVTVCGFDEFGSSRARELRGGVWRPTAEEKQRDEEGTKKTNTDLAWCHGHELIDNVLK